MFCGAFHFGRELLNVRWYNNANACTYTKQDARNVINFSSPSNLVQFTNSELSTLSMSTFVFESSRSLYSLLLRRFPICSIQMFIHPFCPSSCHGSERASLKRPVVLNSWKNKFIWTAICLPSSQSTDSLTTLYLHEWLAPHSDHYGDEWDDQQTNLARSSFVTADHKFLSV
jgi:hypothetical protein